MKESSTNLSLVIKHLETFVVAAHELNFQTTAQKMHISASAVSRRIQQIEEAVGDSLFDRTGHLLQLTSAGQTFLNSAETAFRILEDGVSQLKTEAPSAVRVATLQPIASFFIAPNLAKFHTAYPNTNLDISIEPKIESLENTEYDIAITIGAIENEHHASLATFVGSILCAPQGVNGRPPPKTIDELENFQLLCYSQTPDLWQRVYSSFGKPLPTGLKLKMFNDAGLLLQSAAQGLGVAVGSSPFVDGLLKAGSLVDPFNHTFSTGDGILLKYAPGSLHKKHVVEFAEWVSPLISGMYQQMTKGGD